MHHTAYFPNTLHFSAAILPSISLVRVSMKYEPARGSTVSRKPTSSNQDLKGA